MGLQKALLLAYGYMPKSIKTKVAGINRHIPSAWLYGGEYRKWRKFLAESQYWSDEQKEAYEIKRLKETLENAYYYTPYYKKRFDECGFDVASFRYKDQLSRIPYLTKREIQDNLQSMVNRKISPKCCYYVTTGGSTGIPMGMYRMNEDKIKESAFINYMWEMVGYRDAAKTAILRGSYLGDQGVYHQEGNRLYLSSYHMTETQMEQQYRALERFQPEFLHVYPSAIYILSDYICRKQLPPIHSVKAVLTASENLYSYQREMIQKAFQCRVYDFYGHSEHACMAGECEYSEKYHVYWQYGFTEFINSQGNMAEKNGEMVELVATTYDNAVMPLIRYKTMDLAEYSNAHCECGRNYRLLNRIEGRLQELLITSTGRYISMTAINMHDKIFDHVRQFQFYQDNVSDCVLNIVRDECYTEIDEKMIYHGVKKKLGEELGLTIKYVDEIPRTKNGKYRFLIQKLPVKFGGQEE